MHISIKRATLKSGIMLSYSYSQSENNVSNSYSVNSDALVHPDLQRLFKRFIPHFAFICEEITDVELIKNAIEDPDTYLIDFIEVDDMPADIKKIRSYRVHEVEFKSTNSFDGVKISGVKVLSNGDEISFPAPIQEFDHNYKFFSDLSELCDQFKNEVEQYMDGKQAENKQMEMFGEEEEG